MARAVTWMAKPFTRSVPQGAAAVLYCSLCSELEQIAGQYIMDQAPAVPSDEAQNDEVAEALWERTEELLAG